MKKLTLTTLTILAALFCFGQTTYLTTGLGTGAWSDPQSWKIENGEDISIPTAQDHVVINHTITHFADDGYTHFGDILIGKNGSYEIVSGFEPSAIYIFAGEQFTIEGNLITTADFQHQQAGSEGNGILNLTPTSTVYIGDDLILEANGGVVVNNSSCGAGSSLNDVQIKGAGTYICGSGSFVVGEKVRAWSESGQELTNATESHTQIKSRVCKGFSFYSSSDDCQSNQPIVEGHVDLSPGFALKNFQAELANGQTKLDWTTENELFYDFFTIEKSQDGTLFELAGSIEAKGQMAQLETYHMIDEKPYAGATYYRLKQTMVDGNFAYSHIIKVEHKDMGSLLSVFPNPSNGNFVNLAAENFGKQEKLTLSIKNILGQEVMTQQLAASGNGKLEYRLTHKLESGTYILVVTGKQQRISQMLNVQ
ncbi:MAG: T9SS type A sorting domain-containing protein [Bacteroidota bacterium]